MEATSDVSTGRISTLRLYSDTAAKINQRKFNLIISYLGEQLADALAIIGILALSWFYQPSDLSELIPCLITALLMVMPLGTTLLILRSARKSKKLKQELETLLPAMLIETRDLFLRDEQSKQDTDLVLIEPGLHPLEDLDGTRFIIKGTEIYGDWKELKRHDKIQNGGIRLIEKL